MPVRCVPPERAMDGRQRRLPPVSGPLGHEHPDGPQDARLRGTVPTETHQRRAKLLQIHRLLHLNWSVNTTIAVLKYLKYPAVLLLAFLLVPLCFLNYHVTFFVNCSVFHSKCYFLKIR